MLSKNFMLINNFSKYAATPGNPFWEGVKAFGKQIAEPFTGAAHYWTNGAVGKDYADDSTWIDTTNRVYNNLPGRNQVALQYNDPLLDAGAAALGVSATAAAAAPIAMASPAAAAFLGASERGRNAVTAAGAVGRAFKPILGVTSFASLPYTAQSAIGAALNTTDAINKTNKDIVQFLVNQGYSSEEAARLGFKASWGTFLNTAKHYLSNPYYYMYRRGGNNPIDNKFVDALSNPLPHDMYSGIKQPISVLNAGYMAPAMAALYGGLNQVSGIPGATKNVLSGIANELKPTVQHIQQRSITEPINALETSRAFQALKNYWGQDWNALMQIPAFQANAKLRWQNAQDQAILKLRTLLERNNTSP